MISKSYFLQHSYIRKATPVDFNELINWNTKQLLSRLKELRGLHDFHDFHDLSKEELNIALEIQNENIAIFFKDNEKWKQAYQDVKSILKDREHIPRGSKERRQQAAWEKKHR